MALRRSLILIPVSFLAFCALGPGPARAGYVGNHYVEPGTGLVLDYNVYVPDGYDPTNTTKKYPIMLVLHAANTNQIPPPRTLSSDGVGWSATFVNTPHQKTDPSFFMVPISQTNASGWGEATDPITAPEKFEGRLAVLVLQQVVMTKYPIDPTRLYITGPSMGGRGTWDILRRYPGVFAAAAPAAAPALPTDAALYVNNNIWAVCGQVDPIVQGERDTITAIRALGGNPIYTELAGHGHDSWRWIYPDPQFVPWMYAQRLGVPWWTVSQPPTAPFSADTPPATLSPGWPVVVTPPNLGTSFGGASGGGAAGAGGQPSTGGSGAGGTAGGSNTGAAGTGGPSGTGSGGNLGPPGGGGGGNVGQGGSGVGVGVPGGTSGSNATGGATASGGQPGSGGSAPGGPGAPGSAAGSGAVGQGSAGSSGSQDSGGQSSGCSLAGGRISSSLAGALVFLGFLAFRRRRNRTNN
jgi:poly(3-hydroxybutyrate) depolymerase